MNFADMVWCYREDGVLVPDCTCTIYMTKFYFQHDNLNIFHQFHFQFGLKGLITIVSSLFLMCMSKSIIEIDNSNRSPILMKPDNVLGQKCQTPDFKFQRNLSGHSILRKKL